MKTALFYDTETTGLPLFSEPSEDPRQPHIVQLAAQLVNLDTGRVISTLDVMIKPAGWVIPEEVSQIHGITTEMASDLGISETLAVEMLLDMSKGRLRVAHNEPFDARLVRIACKRFFDEATAEEWKAGAAECTQRLASPIMKLPPTEAMLAKRMRGPKSPNLREAYLHFTGRELENAHSALADVQGCRDVYRAIKCGQLQRVAA